MNILDTFNSVLTPHNEELAEKTGVSPDQVSEVVAQVAPLLLSKMAKNSSTPEGAASLQNALLKDHQGEILNNIKDSLLNSDNSDGLKIIGHILGPDQSKIVKNIADKNGVSKNQANEIMATIAPLLMGVLGKQYAKSKQSESGLSGLLTGFLDQNRNGTIIDDLLRMGMSFLKRK